MGENPTGMAIFSRGGHSNWIFIAEGHKSPARLPATDAERIALYNTGFYGSGTYKIDGHKGASFTIPRSTKRGRS